MMERIFIFIAGQKVTETTAVILADLLCSQLKCLIFSALTRLGTSSLIGWAVISVLRIQIKIAI